MPFIANFPFFCIMLTMASGVISSMLSGKNAYKLNVFATSACLIMNIALLIFMMQNPQQITYFMGHFPAPWGNEIRFGPLEALMATVFSFVMLMSLVSGKDNIFADVKPDKINLFYLMINLLLSSLLALIYTNDIFTAYVFVEINTLSACAVVMAKENGKTLSATIRYLFMSLLGSALFLMSIILMYDLTGHLLMPDMHNQIVVLMQTGKYILPMTIIIGLLAVGMAMKSALFPFHAWLSHAHASATTASSAILSGLVLKGYIFLLIKIFVRVIGLDIIAQLRVTDLLFIFATLGMIIGSIDAMRESHIKRMIAFSSVAQMGYIYMGIGLGTPAGIAAACFHIIVHAITKPMLFSAAGGLSDASGHHKKIGDLKGAAYRNPIAGIAFAIGSFSMIGIPFFAGFASKYYFSTAAIQIPGKMWFALFALAISTVLNAVYYTKALTVFFYREGQNVIRFKNSKTYTFGISAFILVNVALGLCYQPVMNIIIEGLKVF